MGTMAAATIACWIAVADAAPSFLKDGAVGGETFAPQLLVASVVMAVAALVGLRGARVALREESSLRSGSR
jgi:hypothetical protein